MAPRGTHPEGVLEVRALLQDRQGISVRDAIHAAVMLDNSIEQIATSDSGFDGFAGIDRSPPS